MEKTTKTATARNTTEVAMTNRNDLTDAEASKARRETHIVALEPVMDLGNRGRWEYCSIRNYKHVVLTQAYRHVNCDAMTDRDGVCIACGAHSPASTKW
jgi:hypothetical protein